VRRELTRLRVSLALLTERRAALYIAIDVILLFAGLVTAFNGDGIAAVFYASLYVMPLFLVAVPMMSEAVAIERRSGTLDLALTSPGSMNYFERRIASVALLAMLQGWLTLSIPYFMVEHFPLSGPMLQMLIVTLFVASAVLMWSVRLRSAGAVALMTYVTCAAFAPWFFSNPIRPIDADHGPMQLADYLDYFRRNLILGAGAVIFYLYAKQRLSRSESLVT